MKLLPYLPLTNQKRVALRPFPLLINCCCWLFSLLLALPLEARVVYAQPLIASEYKEGFQLKWSTSKEQGSELFVVERSDDGIQYENIGVVKAAGSSTRIKEYKFEDLQLGLTTVFYRLRQVDADGANQTSESFRIAKFAPVNYVISGIEKQASMYTIFIESVIEGPLSVALQSLEGELMIQQEFVVQKGLSELYLDLENEAPGNYSLILKRKGEFYIRNFEIEEDPERKKDRLSHKGDGRGGK